MKEKEERIIENVTFIRLGYNLSTLIIFLLVIIQMLSFYTMIILTSRNRQIGVSSLFVLIFLYIFIYSISFISSTTGYYKYVLTTFIILGIAFLVFAIIDKRIRTGILSQLIIYLLNYIYCLSGWGLVIYFYERNIFDPVMNSDLAMGSFIEKLYSNPLYQIAFFILIAILFSLINLVFIRQYYRKLIRPGN